MLRIKRRLRSLLSPIVSRIYRMIYVSYYGLVFGRPVVGEKRLAALVHALEKRQRLEDIPESKDVWELQYRNKTWDYLANNEEVSRYSVIIGYIQHFKPKASIFDIGCGEGILQERLSTFGYTSYIGLDISETAVQRACLKSDTKTDFISGNAESYVPQELFDVIVFNEVLYYFRDPLETFVRYSKFLKENGIIITSLEHTIRSTAIRRRIKKIYPALVETKITNTHKNFTWFCTAFALSQKTG